MRRKSLLSAPSCSNSRCRRRRRLRRRRQEPGPGANAGPAAGRLGATRWVARPRVPGGARREGALGCCPGPRAPGPGARQPAAACRERSPGPRGSFGPALSADGRRGTQREGGVEGGRRPRPHGQGALSDRPEGDRGHSSGGRSPREGASASPALAPSRPQPWARRDGAVQWEPSVAWPSLWARISPVPRNGDSGVRGRGGGFLQPSLEGPWASAGKFLFQFLSCSPPGKPRWGEGRGRGGGHLTFGSPSPSLSGFLAGGKGGLPLLTIFLPAQESVSVRGEGPGQTAVQGWVGMAGPRPGPALASAKEAPLQPSAHPR